MRRLTMVLALLGAIAALLWKHSRLESDSGLASSGSAAAGRAADAVAPTDLAPGAARVEINIAPGSAVTRSDTLPPADTPVAQAAEHWRAAARLGDRVAAQRLVAALDLCVQVIESRRRLKDPKLERDSRLAEILRRLAAEGGNYCAGYTGDPLRDRFNALLWAAQAGDEGAMKSFVESPPLPGGKAIDYVDLLEAYRDWAPRLALELLQRGDDQIAYTLASAFDEAQGAKRLAPALPARMEEREARIAVGAPRGLETPLGQVLPPDAGQAYRYARLCERAGAQSLRPYCAAIANRLSASQTPDALRAADQWAEGEAKARTYRSFDAPWIGREYDL